MFTGGIKENHTRQWRTALGGQICYLRQVVHLPHQGLAQQVVVEAGQDILVILIVLQPRQNYSHRLKEGRDTVTQVSFKASN